MLLVNFVLELVKFILDFKLIKFFWLLKRLIILLRGQSANLLKQIVKINTHTLKKILKKIGGATAPLSPTIVPSLFVSLI